MAGSAFRTSKVADAIRLFCGKELWKEVGTRLGIDAKSAKNRLCTHR